MQDNMQVGFARVLNADGVAAGKLGVGGGAGARDIAAMAVGPWLRHSGIPEQHGKAPARLICMPAGGHVSI